MMEENDESSMESVEFSDSDRDEDVEAEDKTPGEGLEGQSPNKKILNSQELLNLMTIMVREVRQKKIWLVRRLIKKIKLLKKKKGTAVQKQKNEDHITALQQEVFYSRILDVSKSAKFLLLNTQKDLNKILSYSYKDAKPAVRFQAKLGLIFDSIKQKVESFHNAYPNWREFLPILFHENRQKRRSKLIKMGMFVNKSISRNEQTRYRSSLTAEGKKINESNSIVDSFNSWNVTGEGSNVKLEKVNKNEPGDKGKQKKSENDKTNLATESNSVTKDSNLVTEESKPLSKEKQSSENTSKKRKFSDSEETIPTLVPIDSKPLKVAKKDVVDASPPSLKSDPFFMTADNREYMSSSKSKVPEYNPTKKEDIPKKKFEKKPVTSRHNNFDPEKFNLKFEKKPAFNKSNVGSEKFNPKFSKRTSFGDKSNSKHQFNKNNKNSGNVKINNEKPILHPSWQAKKKLSGITEFKGTKIQFD